MTLNEVKSSLFTFFTSNDMFSMDEKSDFEKICFLSLNKPLDQEIIRAGLREYVKQGILSDVNYQDEAGLSKECWVLNKPIAQYSQSVELGFETVNHIVTIVNNICERTNAKQSLVNPLSIQEKDIQALIVIALDAIENQKM